MKKSFLNCIQTPMRNGKKIKYLYTCIIKPDATTLDKTNVAYRPKEHNIYTYFNQNKFYYVHKHCLCRNVID